MSLLFFFFKGYGDHRDLHSFPTRRSSDRGAEQQVGQQQLSPAPAQDRQHALRQPLDVGLQRHRLLRSEEHTSELQSRQYLVCRLLLEKKKYDLTPREFETVRIAADSDPRF